MYIHPLTMGFSILAVHMVNISILVLAILLGQYNSGSNCRGDLLGPINHGGILLLYLHGNIHPAPADQLKQESLCELLIAQVI